MGEQRFTPPEPLFHLPLLGHVAAAPHDPDDLSLIIPEWSFVDVEEEKFASYIPVLIEPLRPPALKDDRIGVPADLAEGVPVRVPGVGLAFPFGEEHIRLSHRFIGIDSAQEFLADGLVCEEVLTLRIFCPYEIRNIIAHHPDEVVEVAESPVGPGKLILRDLPLRYIAEHEEVCFLSPEEDRRTEPFDPLLISLEIPYRVAGEVSATPGLHVLEVRDGGLYVVGADELQNIPVDKFGRGGGSAESDSCGVGKLYDAVRIKYEDGVPEGVKGSQVSFYLWIILFARAGGDDAGDLRVG